MFKRKLKIKQLSTSNSESFWYVCGLGNDGNVYIWDKFAGKWVLNHQQQPQPGDELPPKEK